MRVPFLAGLGSLALVVGVAGCKSTTTVGYPAEYVSMKSPSHIWVTTADKKVVEMYNPQIKGDSGDTLVGFASKTGGYTEIPVSQVQIMKAQEVSLAKSMVLAGAISIGMALLVSQTQGSAPYCANFAPGAANNGLVQPCGTTNGKPNTAVTGIDIQ